LAPATALVCRGRDGVRASHIDRGPPAAGDPQADCGMSCDRLDPAMSLYPSVHPGRTTT